MKQYKIPTFADRRKRIHSIEDIDTQLGLAKAYVATLRRDMKKADSLEQKVQIGDAVIKAERVLRELRRASFDIEDEINASSCV